MSVLSVCQYFFSYFAYSCLFISHYSCEALSVLELLYLKWGRVSGLGCTQDARAVQARNRITLFSLPFAPSLLSIPSQLLASLPMLPPRATVSMPDCFSRRNSTWPPCALVHLLLRHGGCSHPGSRSQQRVAAAGAEYWLDGTIIGAVAAAWAEPLSDNGVAAAHEFTGRQSWWSVIPPPASLSFVGKISCAVVRDLISLSLSQDLIFLRISFSCDGSKFVLFIIHCAVNLWWK